MSLYVEDNRLKCTECTINIDIDKLPKNRDPLKIHHSCKRPKYYNGINRPGIIKKALNLTKAGIKHFATGKKATKENLHKLRLEICNLCRHGNNEECFICGCSIPVKASWAEQKCPVGNWPRNMTDLIFTRHNGKDTPAYLENKFYEAGCFFIGSGPSLEKTHTDLLKERGILSFAVNNIAAYSNIRPNFWCSCDDPSSFHKVIWNDGAIMKFIRRENYDKIKTPPNTYYFDVNKDFFASTFFTEYTINFGNEGNLIDEYGGKGRRSVMHCAIRIMYHLGIRRIYLIGCDFKMDENRPYVFDQKKWYGGCKTNNDGFVIMNKRFAALNEESKKYGLKIYNCTPGSHLTAFENLDYNEAIKREKFETPTSLANMYGDTKNG